MYVAPMNTTTANPLDPTTRLSEGGHGYLTSCTENTCVVMGMDDFRWGIGASISEAIHNAKLKRAKSGSIIAYIFPGPDFTDIGITNSGQIQWTHPAGWYPIKTTV